MDAGGALVCDFDSASGALSGFADFEGGSETGGGGAVGADDPEVSTPPAKATTFGDSIDGFCATTSPLWGGNVSVGGVSLAALARPFVFSAASSFSRPRYSMILSVTVSPRNLSKSIRANRAFCSAALMSLIFWFN